MKREEDYAYLHFFGIRRLYDWRHGNLSGFKSPVGGSSHALQRILKTYMELQESWWGDKLIGKIMRGLLYGSASFSFLEGK